MQIFAATVKSSMVLILVSNCTSIYNILILIICFRLEKKLFTPHLGDRMEHGPPRGLTARSDKSCPSLTWTAPLKDLDT